MSDAYALPDESWSTQMPTDHKTYTYHTSRSFGVSPRSWPKDTSSSEQRTAVNAHFSDKNMSRYVCPPTTSATVASKSESKA